MIFFCTNPRLRQRVQMRSVIVVPPISVLILSRFGRHVRRTWLYDLLTRLPWLGCFPQISHVLDIRYLPVVTMNMGWNIILNLPYRVNTLAVRFRRPFLRTDAPWRSYGSGACAIILAGRIFLCSKNDLMAAQAADICSVKGSTASRCYCLLRRAILRESSREAAGNLRVRGKRGQAAGVRAAQCAGSLAASGTGKPATCIAGESVAFVLRLEECALAAKFQAVAVQPQARGLASVFQEAVQEVLS